MAPRKQVLPDYGVVTVNGKEYYRTRMIDQDGKRFSLYRASAGRDPWPQMGFRLSGCRCPLFDCSAGMAYGKQQTSDPERTENEGGKAKYTYSYPPAGGIA